MPLCDLKRYSREALNAITCIKAKVGITKSNIENDFPITYMLQMLST